MGLGRGFTSTDLGADVGQLRLKVIADIWLIYWLFRLRTYASVNAFQWVAGCVMILSPHRLFLAEQIMRLVRPLSFTFLAVFLSVAAATVVAQDKSNILVIFGDDIGPYNIDRIANEGIIFTDSYGDQSCTASRAGFITGQPGAKEGLQPEDPTIAVLLKPHGYMTAQFSKNHQAVGVSEFRAG